MVIPDGRRDGKVTREVVLSTAQDLIDRDGADGLDVASSVFRRPRSASNR
jgi:hypothetical protein